MKVLKNLLICLIWLNKLPIEKHYIILFFWNTLVRNSNQWAKNEDEYFREEDVRGKSKVLLCDVQF